VNKNVLLVDDSRSARQYLRALLAAWGYDVTEARSGNEAARAFRGRHASIVITDLHMPDGSGWDLIKSVRAEETRYTYIIVVSAVEEKEKMAACLDLGADDYLTKPFHAEELRARLGIAERLVRLETQDLLIFSLAKMTEYRSNETGNHLERVKHTTRVLCDEVLRAGSRDLSSHLASHIVSLSCLHDIGKVGIPDAILNKPGRLTSEEFEIMKRHTLIGGSIMEDLYGKTKSESLAIARDIIIHHHERFDGVGYPSGLSGEAIPLSARIMALADVYDALSSKRVYKDAYGRDECRRIIETEDGKHFDPAVVAAFRAKEPVLWEISLQLRDGGAAVTAETPQSLSVSGTGVPSGPLQETFRASSTSENEHMRGAACAS
jgi:putative two-component system response regulator